MTRQNHQDLIYRDLRGGIQAGDFPPNSPLPSLRVLADRYKTSTGTVRQALSRLRIEGHIDSRHGKGNFVSENRLETQDVILIAQLEGHLFSELTCTFSDVFSRHPEYRLLLEKAPRDKKEEKRLSRKIELGVKAGNLNAVFFDGLEYLHTDFLKNYLDEIGVYCFHSGDKLAEFVCPHVVSDWFHGGFIGIQHLCSQGCRKILVIAYPAGLESPTNCLHPFLDGCRQASETAGTPLIEFFYEAEAIEYPDQFADIMRKHPDIDGIFSLGDFRLRPLYPVLKEMKRDIGGNIALLGYYDTPWAQAMDPSLSSITTHPKKIVETLCDLYFKGDTARKFRTIPPELVIRESSNLNKNGRV